MDPKATLARSYHHEAQKADGAARQFRLQRDRMVRQLRREDPRWWSYARLAKAVGCSRELIAVILKEQS